MELTTIITLLTLAATCWLSYNNMLLNKSMLELKLNLMSEMNGRYVRVGNFNDAKDRILRLEQQHDSEKDDGK